MNWTPRPQNLWSKCNIDGTDDIQIESSSVHDKGTDPQAETDLNSTLQNLAIYNILHAIQNKRKNSGSHAPWHQEQDNKSTQTSNISLNNVCTNATHESVNCNYQRVTSNSVVITKSFNKNARTVKFSTNNTNKNLNLPIQELTQDYQMIDGFKLEPAEMEIWRKFRSCSTNAMKYDIRASHLNRCIFFIFF